MTTDQVLNKKLRQVQALLDRAEHPNTPAAEAAESRGKAEMLMAKYRIEEESVRKDAMAKGIESIKPIIEEFAYADLGSEYAERYRELLYIIIDHVGNIRMATTAKKVDEGTADERYAKVAYLVGFESDVRYAIALYSSLRLHFANTLEPKVDPSLSDEDNVYRLRNAGIERPRIGDMMGWGREAAQKVTNVYKKACAARGEDPKVVGKSLNVKTYRDSFADSYVNTIWERLDSMRLMAGLSNTGVVLAGRKEAVNEEFYERFPHLRPITRKDRQLGEGTTGGPGGNCPKCNKTKSGYCRDHQFLKPTKGQDVKYSRTGAQAGAAAGRAADLGSTGTNNRLEK